jgi:hypothetical protein
MYIHIGENKLVSGRNLVGIFNIETLALSQENKHLLASSEETDKTLALDINNKTVCSKVSPYTVIKRTSITEDAIWRKENND